MKLFSLIFYGNLTKEPPDTVLFRFKNCGGLRNVLLLENLQFLSDFFETHKWVILTKSLKNPMKIADFLIIAYYWTRPHCGWLRNILLLENPQFSSDFYHSPLVAGISFLNKR